MFVTNWISTTKIQKISEITNFFRHYFLSRTEVIFENWTLKVYDYKIFDLSIFQLIIQLYSIAYFVVNFKSLQNLNNQIGDAIND